MWPPNGLTQQRVKATTVTAGIWMEFIEGRTLADLLEAQGSVSARGPQGSGSTSAARWRP